MDPRDLRAAVENLAMLEVLQNALARRDEVLEAVWNAHDKDEAFDLIRHLRGVQPPAHPFVVLDMPTWRLTKGSREEIATSVALLRDRVESLSEDDQGSSAEYTKVRLTPIALGRSVRRRWSPTWLSPSPEPGDRCKPSAPG